MASKKRFLSEAEEQMERAANTPEEGHTEETPQEGSRARKERLVIRLSQDELRRIQRFYAQENIPVATGIRSLVLTHIRRAR